MRNRWFESISLHQRVSCEPDFRASDTRLAAITVKPVDWVEAISCIATR